MVVVLPEPFAPSSAKIVPRPTVKSMPSRTCVAPNDLRRPVTAMATASFIPASDVSVRSLRHVSDSPDEIVVRELAEVLGCQPVRARRLTGDREAHHLDLLSIATRERHRDARCARGQPRGVGGLVAGVGLPRQHGEFVGGAGVIVGHTMSLIGRPVVGLASR